jgi:hypothetical protein
MTYAVPQAPAVPPDIDLLARQHGLGSLRAVYEANKRTRLLVASGVLALIFVAIGVGTLFSSATPPSQRYPIGAVLIGIPLALFLVVLVNSPVFSSKTRTRRFYLFEHGYVQVGRRGTDARSFGSVMSIYQSIVQTRVNGINSGTNYTYRLAFADGATAKLTTWTANMAQLGPVLMREVAQAQVPRIAAALDAGKPVSFGPFDITRDGLITGGRITPWSSIPAVSLERGFLRVSQGVPGQKKYPNLVYIQASKVANLYAFLHVADKLRGQ